ncbi:hypothetical protein, partial [Undibacterium luofuense]|uniref:hypothetical protein n=1 Tax=Undibacterium luofuense TaxID=2828733 RepID=UPI0030EE0460
MPTKNPDQTKYCFTEIFPGFRAIFMRHQRIEKCFKSMISIRKSHMTLMHAAFSTDPTTKYALEESLETE